MDFIAQVALGEPHDMFPSDPAPLVCGLISGDRMLAAAAVHCPDDSSWCLDYLCVIPDVRRQGYGSVLLQEVETWMRTLGARTLRVMPLGPPDVEMSKGDRGFYEKHGYAPLNESDSEVLVKQLGVG